MGNISGIQFVAHPSTKTSLNNETRIRNHHLDQISSPALLDQWVVWHWNFKQSSLGLEFGHLSKFVIVVVISVVIGRVL